MSDGQGGYTFDFDGGCDNMFGCNPSLLQAKASFVNYIMGPSTTVRWQFLFSGENQARFHCQSSTGNEIDLFLPLASVENHAAITGTLNVVFAFARMLEEKGLVDRGQLADLLQAMRASLVEQNAAPERIKVIDAMIQAFVRKPPCGRSRDRLPLPRPGNRAHIATLRNEAARIPSHELEQLLQGRLWGPKGCALNSRARRRRVGSMRCMTFSASPNGGVVSYQLS
jgi:hypothetical protein